MKSYVRRFLPVLAILLLATVSTTARADIFVVDNVDVNSGSYDVETANYFEPNGAWSYAIENATEAPSFNGYKAWTGDSSETAVWSFTGLENGTYDVFVYWPSTTATAYRTTVNYAVSDSGGTYVVDQKLVPTADLMVQDDDEDYDYGFQKLGAVTIADGTLDVTLSFSSGYACSDAVAIQSVGGEIPDVPEPGMLVLMAVGAACLLLRRRK